MVVHQMAGFDPKRREAYDIPQGWEPIAAMAIGIRDAASLPEPLQSREKLAKQEANS